MNGAFSSRAPGWICGYAVAAGPVHGVCRTQASMRDANSACASMRPPRAWSEPKVCAGSLAWTLSSAMAERVGPAAIVGAQRVRARNAVVQP
jgi:hypothetical protein